MTGNPEQRARELLTRMTIEEKAQQVTGLMPLGFVGHKGLIRSEAERLLSNGIGHFGMLSMLGHNTPARLASIVNTLQRYLVEETRLGIPAIFHLEALNGLVAPHFTTFPTAIALAATWNPDGVEAMGEVLRRQVRAVGHPHVLSPVMDVARDPRWGRVHETCGEDPYLVTAFSVSYTRGLQGEDPSTGVIATGKHFLGYATTEGGQNMAATSVGSRELYEVYARPFEAAIKLAGLRSVMNSYSTVDGEPVGASHALLNDLLRERMGFTGTVVSDYGTIERLVDRQHVAKDLQDAGRLALAAGIDVELPTPAGYGATLAQAVLDGVVPEAELDRSVLHVLRDKFALGLFDHPYVDEEPVQLAETASAGGELALELARQSVILLKNDGTLPLSPEIRKIAVVGPHAQSVAVAFPGYTYMGALGLMAGAAGGSESNMQGTEGATDDLPAEAKEFMFGPLGSELADGLDGYGRRVYGAESLDEAIRRLAPHAEVVVVEGSAVVDGQPTDYPAAVAAAEDADVVILAIGGRGVWFAGPHVTEGEGADRADISLPAAQVELVRRVAATGTRAIGVVFAGRPIALPEIDEVLPALVYACYGGQRGVSAVAEVLFGHVNPSGKLPYTLPRHSGQVPIHVGQHTGSGYHRTPADTYRAYTDMPLTPLYPFGHGLSYTNFDYSELELSAVEVPTDGEVSLAVTVINSGDRTGTEIVQLYFSDTASGLTRPAQELVGFARVPLVPGASARVTFRVGLNQLGYVGIDGRFILEPGPIEVLVGSSSDNIRQRASFEAVGDVVHLEGRRGYLSTVDITYS